MSRFVTLTSLSSSSCSCCALVLGMGSPIKHRLAEAAGAVCVGATLRHVRVISPACPACCCLECCSVMAAGAIKKLLTLEPLQAQGAHDTTTVSWCLDHSTVLQQLGVASCCVRQWARQEKTVCCGCQPNLWFLFVLVDSWTHPAGCAAWVPHAAPCSGPCAGCCIVSDDRAP
jgi:hypothetical protein